MKMQTVLKAIALAAIAVSVTGCATTAGQTTVRQAQQGATVAGNDTPTLKVMSCPKSVMTVSLSPLKCKAASCQSTAQGTGNMAALIALAKEKEGIPDLSGFGDGMTDMLTSSIQATGCFDVLDRELMAELAREQQLAGKTVSLQGADTMATGSITSLSFDKAKTNFGGGLVPVIGGISTSKVTAKIGMDVRVVDVNTGRVAYTKTYKAESGKRSFGIAGAGLIGSGLFGGSHSVKGSVEMEEAAREIIQNVTNDMVESLAPAGSYNVKYVEVTAGN